MFDYTLLFIWSTCFGHATDLPKDVVQYEHKQCVSHYTDNEWENTWWFSSTQSNEHFTNKISQNPLRLLLKTRSNSVYSFIIYGMYLMVDILLDKSNTQSKKDGQEQ